MQVLDDAYHQKRNQTSSKAVKFSKYMLKEEENKSNKRRKAKDSIRAMGKRTEKLAVIEGTNSLSTLQEDEMAQKEASED